MATTLYSIFTWLSKKDHVITEHDVNDLKARVKNKKVLACLPKYAGAAGEERDGKKGYEWAKTPLHAVAQLHRGEHAVEALQVLLEAWPEGTQKAAGKYCQLPLHTVAHYQRDPVAHGMVEALLKAFPQGAEVKDADEHLPLHMCLWNGSFDSALALLAVYPGGAKDPGLDGSLPLHRVIRQPLGERGLQLAKELLKTYPASVAVNNEEDDLPLHLAVKHHSGADALALVRAVIHAYEGATDAAAAHERLHVSLGPDLPLHHATQHQNEAQTVDLIKTLHKSYGDGIRMKRKKDGHLALHIAAQYQKNEHRLTVINTLLDLHRDGAKQQGKIGDTALHVAARYQNDDYDGVTVLNALVAANLDAARAKDKNGDTPLHIAARYQNGDHGVNVIKVLSEAYPPAIHEANTDGKTPIDLAQDAVVLAQLQMSKQEGPPSGVLLCGKRPQDVCHCFFHISAFLSASETHPFVLRSSAYLPFAFRPS